MIKFDWYYYRDEASPKLIFSLDWYFHEDTWHRTHMLGKPLYDAVETKERQLLNAARCRYFLISLNLCHLRVSINLKTKLVGNIYYGRVMKNKMEGEG